MMYYQIIAMILLDPTCPRPEIPDHHWSAVSYCVQRLAVDMEILDDRECTYILAKPGDYETDLALLRNRRHELAELPRVAESMRLPDRQLVNDLIVFNRAYRLHLFDRRTLEKDREDVLADATRETDYLYQVYDAIRDARCDFYYVVVRRRALHKLRAMIGEDAYLAVDIPPVVPIWRFNER